jgi:hypothetical protein
MTAARNSHPDYLTDDKRQAAVARRPVFLMRVVTLVLPAPGGTPDAMTTTDTIASNLAAVRERIARAAARAGPRPRIRYASWR